MNPDAPRFESPTAVQGPRAPLVIVGPTASGKSALAVELALLVGGLGAVGPVEIVSADAMAVYRGMDVGTAKPPIAERRGVVHHLLDVADPAEEYTVARFQEEAKQAIASIEARGGLPIVVGGTGLYVRSVVDDFTMPGRYPRGPRGDRGRTSYVEALDSTRRARPGGGGQDVADEPPPNRSSARGDDRLRSAVLILRTRR